MPTTPTDRPNVTGKGSATATLAGRKLTISGALMAWPLRRPLPGSIAVSPRARGAAIGDLTVTQAASGKLSGSIDLTAEQVEALKQGKRMRNCTRRRVSARWQHALGLVAEIAKGNGQKAKVKGQRSKVVILEVTMMLRKSSLLAFASLVASGVLLTGQQPAGGHRGAGDAGQGGAYEANCASCHGSDLMGAPPLAGEGFIGGWRTRSTRDMYNLIRTRCRLITQAGCPRTTTRTSSPTSFNITALPQARHR